MYRAQGPQDISADDQFGRMFNEHYAARRPVRLQNPERRVLRSCSTSTPFTDIKVPIYAGGGKSLVYDHAADAFPGHVRIEPEDLIVYELHVQDYTARLEALEPGLRGTYLGLAQSGLTTPGGLAAGIDHLVELGVTAVELMPVMEYDEETGNVAGRLNHWGYMTTNFFAPEARYAAVEGEQVIELKQLVKAFHDRGIAVFLDVVYNHTGEQGPWVRAGAAGRQVLQPHVHGAPPGLSRHPGRAVLLQQHRHRQRRELHGRRRPLHQAAGRPTRSASGTTLTASTASASTWRGSSPTAPTAPPTGSTTMRISPPRTCMPSRGTWAASGGTSWTISAGATPTIAGRSGSGSTATACGASRSPGLRDRSAFKRLIEGYGLTDDGSPASTRPWRSVNFIAVHDGYTLRDCTFFNDAGGSHNCWDSGGDENLRRERSKLLLGVLLTSQGVPLILQGDEFGRTKSGARSQADAHNTYNYKSATGDPAINHVNWIDWRLKDGDAGGSPNAPAYGQELFDWTRGLIALRKQWSHFRRADFADVRHGRARTGAANDGRFTYAWEGPAEGEPSQLAVIWWGKAGEPDLMVVYNEHWEPFTRDQSRRLVAGQLAGPGPVVVRRRGGPLRPSGLGDSCPDAGGAIEVKGRSMAILISDND